MDASATMKRCISLWVVAALESVNVVADSRGFLGVEMRLETDGAGSGSGSGLGSGSGSGSTDVKGGSQTTLKTTLETMVGKAMQWHAKGPSMGDIARVGHNKMQLQDAVRQLDGKLPEDVAALLRLTGGQGNSKRAALDEASMQKARKILNNMIYGAWLELDDVVFECKEFQERNRGTYEQVVSDLARLGSQLAKLGEEQVSANQGVAKADTERKDADTRLQELQSQFTQTRFENNREMSIRKNDLAVFYFILQATACKDGAIIQMHQVNR